MKCKYCNNNFDSGDNNRCPYCGALLENDNNEQLENVNENNIEEIDNTISNEAVIEHYQYSPKRYLLSILIYYLIMLVGAALIVMVVTAIYAQISSEPIIIDNQITEAATNKIQIWTQILTYLALLCAVTGILFKDLLSDFKGIKPNLKKIFINAAVGLAVMYGVSIILAIFYQVIKLNGDAQNQTQIENMLLNATLIEKFFYGIVIVIVAPLVEELIFRKCLFGIFKKTKINKILIVIITGFIFGFMHISTAILGYVTDGTYNLILPELLYGIDYIAMGIIFGFVYYKSDENLFSSLLLHVVNNLISIIMIFATLK